MKEFKLLSKNAELIPQGILNGYYNHNIPYDDLKPYFKSCCGVDIYSEVEVTTYDELMLLDKWVNVWVLGVVIDGVVYSCENIGDKLDLPSNWESNKKYIYEYMIVTYDMLDKTNAEDDAWEETVYEINHLNPEIQPEKEGGVYVDLSNRLTMLEDILKHNI